MPDTMLSRRRFLALAAALAGVATCGAAAPRALEAAAAPAAGRVAYPTAEQVASFSFMCDAYRARMDAGEHPFPVLGSSELNPRVSGWAHPARLLSGAVYSVDAWMVGRADASSIWHAVELAALASELGIRRAALFVSMQWFMCYRKPARSLPGVYSADAYRALQRSADISEGLKARVADRLSAYGLVDLGGSPLTALTAEVDAAVGSAVEVTRLDAMLAGVGQPRLAAETSSRSGAAAAGATAPHAGDHPRLADGSPDWATIVARAAAEAIECSRGNAEGYYDSWYQKKYQKWIAGATSTWQVDDGAYWSAQELDDFKMALEAAREAGVELLVVIQPVRGTAYDQTIYTADVRAGYYDLVRTACAEAGVQTADFSGHEYERTFLYDYSHPSALGAAEYSHALYDFFAC